MDEFKQPWQNRYCTACGKGLNKLGECGNYGSCKNYKGSGEQTRP